MLDLSHAWNYKSGYLVLKHGQGQCTTGSDTFVYMDYNCRLKHISNKGLCGDPEIVEETKSLEDKVQQLVTLICESKRIVLFTGAGISTSSGIPDFRGPNGVWTKEQRGEVADPKSVDNTFDLARPTYTHYTMACLLHLGIVAHIVSQNVDGLHLRSGVSEEDLSELHGNIFKEKCSKCSTEYLRNFDVGGMGLQPTGRYCENASCNGVLCDMAVDWDTALPHKIFSRAEREHDLADLVICMGSSLRVNPAGNIPLRVFKPKKLRGGEAGKIVIVNLQKTHLDNKATIRISHYCDEVSKRLCDILGIRLDDTTKIANAKVKSWYYIEKGSIAEELVRRRIDELSQVPEAPPVNVATKVTATTKTTKPAKIAKILQATSSATSNIAAATQNRATQKRKPSASRTGPTPTNHLLSLADVLDLNEHKFKMQVGKKRAVGLVLDDMENGSSSKKTRSSETDEEIY